MRMTLCQFGLLAIVACGSPEVTTSRLLHQSPHVRITELSATPTSEFTNAAILTDSSAITWSEGKPSLTLVSRHGTLPLTVPFVVVGAAPNAINGLLQLLDRDGYIHLLSERGTILNHPRIAAGIRFHVAIRRLDGWLAVADQADGPALLRLADATHTNGWTVKLPLPARALRASGGQIRLLPSRRGAIVIASLPPFDVLSYSEAGKLTNRLALADDSTLSTLMSAQKEPAVDNWRLVAGVSIDNLALLTLSDLNSDRRIIALVDPQNGVLTSREITVPLALVSGNAEWLLAGRRTDRFELVRYRWGWDHSLEEGQ
jgi:hypothetical protein